MLSERHIRQAAYWIGEEIERRRRFGHPIPPSLGDLFAVLNCEVSARGRESGVTAPDPSRWKTTKQLAAELGCNARTVRRRAAEAGGRKIHDRWVFDQEDTT